MYCQKRLVSSGLLFFLVASASAASASPRADYPPPPYRDEEKICGESASTVEVVDCLVGHLSEAEGSLENVISLLTEWWGSDPESRPYIERLSESQAIWEDDVENTCTEMLFNYWVPGSMARTEPIRCKFLMTRERERLLRLLYYKPLEYLESRDQ